MKSSFETIGLFCLTLLVCSTWSRPVSALGDASTRVRALLVIDTHAENFNIAPVDSGPSWESISNLFLHARGLVDITATSPGTVALSGLLTDSMIETLEYPRRDIDLNRNGFLTWQEFLATVRLRTNAKYVAIRPNSQYEIVRRQEHQLPYAFALPGEGSATTPGTPPERQPAPGRAENKTYVVTVIQNPYNIQLSYQYRWGETGQWTSAVLKPRASLAHHKVYNPTNCPFLNIQYDSVLGDNGVSVSGYRLEGYLSFKQTQGKQYRFFTRGQSILDVGLRISGQENDGQDDGGRDTYKHEAPASGYGASFAARELEVVSIPRVGTMGCYTF